MNLYDTLLAKALSGSGGGGGSSNIASGSFQFSENGSHDVSINYSGTGYPIAVMIYVHGGFSDNTEFVEIINRYKIGFYAAQKMKGLTAPEYGGYGNDSARFVAVYKNSTSSPTSYSQSGNSTFAFKDVDASTDTYVQIRNATTLAVFVTNASGYAFMPDIQYDYVVVYSA
jgi:hypothetical protein